MNQPTSTTIPYHIEPSQELVNKLNDVLCDIHFPGSKGMERFRLAFLGVFKKIREALPEKHLAVTDISDEQRSCLHGFFSEEPHPMPEADNIINVRFEFWKRVIILDIPEDQKPILDAMMVMFGEKYETYIEKAAPPPSTGPIRFVPL